LLKDYAVLYILTYFYTMVQNTVAKHLQTQHTGVCRKHNYKSTFTANVSYMKIANNTDRNSTIQKYEYNTDLSCLEFISSADGLQC